MRLNGRVDYVWGICVCMRGKCKGKSGKEKVKRERRERESGCGASGGECLVKNMLLSWRVLVIRGYDMFWVFV